MQLQDFTSERLQAFLKQESINFDVLDDGDLLVGFENGLFFHSVRQSPPVWAFRSTWRGNIPPHDLEAAQRLVNEWNQDSPFPKVYFSKDEEDTVWQVNGEAHFLTAGGMSDAQLEFNHRVALGTSFELFETIENAFPHLVTWNEV